jgi:hypothetical protein
MVHRHKLPSRPQAPRPQALDTQSFTRRSRASSHGGDRRWPWGSCVWRVLRRSSTRPELLRVWLLALVAFFLLGAAWALALPSNGTYDEKQHIVRAYAVADGQLLPVRHTREETFLGSDAFAVPATLIPGNSHCVWYPQPKPASCQKADPRHGTILHTSGAARYSPIYYLPVGLPMLISPDYAGVVAGRLVSALLAALLLASAVVSAVRLGSRMMVAGVALVCTPLAMNLGGAINPNGLEIAAAVLLFTTMLALLRADDLDRRATRRLVWLTGLAIGLLLVLRQLGPALVAVDVGTCLMLAGRARTKALLRRRDVRWVAGAFAVLGTAYFAAWTVLSSFGDLPPSTSRAQHVSALRLGELILVRRVPFYLQQPVAQFGYGETHVSPVVIALWYALLGALVVPALWYGSRRLRWSVALLLGSSAALLVGMEAYFARSLGWTSQGRYAMPIAVGAVIVAGYSSLERSPDPHSPAGRAPGLGAGRWLTHPAVLVAATVPLHIYVLAFVLTRYRSGIGQPLDPFAGAWQPLWGPIPPLVACAAGAALLTWLAYSGVAGRRTQPSELPVWSPVTGARQGTIMA